MLEKMSHNGSGLLLVSAAHNSELAGRWHFHLQIHARKAFCLLKVAVSMYVPSLRGPSTSSHHCQSHS